jgi:negative regulator of flagellin synthesis FlgM
MVDSIKNTFSRIDPQRSKLVDNGGAGTGKVKASAPAPTAPRDNGVEVNSAVKAELTKSAPIDSEAVQRIKSAISAGKYPIDLDRVSDALLDAYMEIKS